MSDRSVAEIVADLRDGALTSPLRKAERAQVDREAADRLVDLDCQVTRLATLAVNEGTELDGLRPQLAAVVAALDQYDRDHRSLDAEVACVAAIAEAVRR